LIPMRIEKLLPRRFPISLGCGFDAWARIVAAYHALDQLSCSKARTFQFLDITRSEPPVIPITLCFGDKSPNDIQVHHRQRVFSRFLHLMRSCSVLYTR
jgi:hypothetical protein